MNMKEYSINELGGLITVCAGAVATILFALQKSRCTHIKCCGDPSCIREPKPQPAPDVEDPPPQVEEQPPVGTRVENIYKLSNRKCKLLVSFFSFFS